VAFESQSAAEALATASEEHAEVLSEPAWRPFDASASEVKDYYGDFQARVNVPGEPNDAFVQSMLPLRAETESGADAPVDLSLEEQADGLEPKTPLVETTIPEQLDEGVALDDSGIGFAPQGAAQASDAQLERDTAFYANVGQDTDFLVRPEPTGAQAMWQLRSADSPESVALNFSLPPGATIAEAGDLGGARIVRNGEEIGQVTWPMAWDAEGWPVDVSFQIEGDRMVIEVPHRDQDLAYPILIDPRVYEVAGFNSDYDLAGWSHYKYPSTSPRINNRRASNGFIETTGAPGTYEAGEGGGWQFLSPGPEVLIYAAEFANVIANQHKSVVLQGIWSPTRNDWDQGITTNPTFPNSPISYAGQIWTSAIRHCLGPDNVPCVGGTPGNQVLSTMWSPTASSHTSEFRMWTDGATVWMLDMTPPSARLADHSPEWVDAEAPIEIEARDRGLGVKAFSLRLDSGAERIRTHACAGDRFDRCPNNDSYYPSNGARVAGNSFTYDTSGLSEGEHTLTAKAKDFADNWSQPQAMQVTVDHTDPDLELQGGLASNEDQMIGQDDLAVGVAATDEASGVTSLKLLIDGEQLDDITQNCETGGCPLDADLWPEEPSVTGGNHTYEVIAKDGAGNTSTRSGSFELDPEPPVLTASGELADTAGEPLEAASAIVEAGATEETSGDSGLAELKIKVDDTVVTTEAFDCDGSCPNEGNATYSYAKSDWGPGPHLVTLTATDAAGNTAEQVLQVDPPAESTTLDCPEVTPTVQEAGDALTAAEAEAEALPSAVAASQETDSELMDTHIDPSLRPEDGSSPESLEAAGSLQNDVVAANAAGGLTLEDVICLVPTQTTADETDAHIVNGDSALYANSATDTDTIVRPTASGETIIESLRGPDAPNSFSWEVGLPDGAELRELEGGGIAVVDPSEPADPDLWVPPAPDGETDPAAIPDASAQVDNAHYQNARAEQETGLAVAAVIAPPYAVLANGSIQPTPVTISGPSRITAQSPPMARTLAVAAVKGPAKCLPWNGLELVFPGGQDVAPVSSQICIVDHKEGTYGLWKGKGPGPSGNYHLSARLQLRTEIAGNLHSRSREAIILDLPSKLRTRTAKSKARWCTRLWQHTRNVNFKIVWRHTGPGICWKVNPFD